MKGEHFLHRWSRLKSAGGAAVAPLSEAAARQGISPATPQVGAVAAPAPIPPIPPIPPAPLPTLQDVARLTAESDYSSYVAQGVDRAVRRLAMKKLFSDPHFNIIDGLDIHMGDYNQADPVPAAMLAALQHAQDFMQRTGVMAVESENVPIAAAGQAENQDSQNDGSQPTSEGRV